MAGDGKRLDVAVPSSATRWQGNTTPRRKYVRTWLRLEKTPDEIEAQRKRRKFVSRYNAELARHTETEVVTQDPDEEIRADSPCRVQAECPPLTVEARIQRRREVR